MTTSWGLLGHQRQIQQLERAVGRGAVAHAYLITGPPRVGKSALALALARRLTCTGAEPPCGACRPCRAIAAGTFPDVTVVEPLAEAGGADDDGPEGRKRWITIAQVRELQRNAALTPFEADRKVFILLDAENLQGPASDALLKTLEEPPARSVLILTARDARLLPPTVTSRCRLVSLGPVHATEIAAGLEGRGVDRERTAGLARLARGRPGWAIEAAGSGGVAERRERVLADWIALLEAGSPARLLYAQTLEKTLKQDRAAFEEAMELWLGWWRDLLLMKAECPDLVVNADQEPALRRWAGRLGLGDILEYTRAILSTLRGLNENAQPRLALEALVISLPSPSAGRR